MKYCSLVARVVTSASYVTPARFVTAARYVTPARFVNTVRKRAGMYDVLSPTSGCQIVEPLYHVFHLWNLYNSFVVYLKQQNNFSLTLADVGIIKHKRTRARAHTDRHTHIRTHTHTHTLTHTHT